MPKCTAHSWHAYKESSVLLKGIRFYFPHFKPICQIDKRFQIALKSRILIRFSPLGSTVFVNFLNYSNFITSEIGNFSLYVSHGHLGNWILLFWTCLWGNRKTEVMKFVKFGKFPKNLNPKEQNRINICNSIAVWSCLIVLEKRILGAFFFAIFGSKIPPECVLFSSIP